MIITKKSVFDVAWRVAILVLPWQTRWIFSTPTVNGSPWEQGVVAVYASWIPLVVAVIVGISFLGRREVRTRRMSPATKVCAGAIAALAAVSVLTSSPMTSFMWAIHMALLAAFGWVLVRHHVSRLKLASWFVISLMPHVGLAFWQFIDQKIEASTLLGIAAQRGWMSGSSVVEYGEYRVLRAYGGFPHPNLFGGWLALALTILPGIVHRTPRSAARYAWITCTALMAMALVFTFSRGAWVAAIIGSGLALLLPWRSLTKHERQSIILGTAVIVPVALMSIFSQWEAVSSRVHADERLERWSVEQRVTSYRDGWDAFLLRPLVGWGPGAGLMGVAALDRPRPPAIPALLVSGEWGMYQAPLELPHVIPVVIMTETGIIGLFANVALVWLLFRHLIIAKQFKTALPLVAVWGVLSLVDHYLWSFWAGQSLTMLLAVLMLLIHKPSESVRG